MRSIDERSLARGTHGRGSCFMFACSLCARHLGLLLGLGLHRKVRVLLLLLLKRLLMMDRRLTEILKSGLLLVWLRMSH